MVVKTKSGLWCIDLVEGTGISPRYGNFVSISYKSYIKLPDTQESHQTWVWSHRVPTMKVGGKRRIIIPPKWGYVTSGLEPIPPGLYGCWKLNQLLDRVVDVKRGV